MVFLVRYKWYQKLGIDSACFIIIYIFEYYNYDKESYLVSKPD